LKVDRSFGSIKKKRGLETYMLSTFHHEKPEEKEGTGKKKEGGTRSFTKRKGSGDGKIFIQVGSIDKKRTSEGKRGIETIASGSEGKRNLFKSSKSKRSQRRRL